MQAELSDVNNVLFLVTLADDANTLKRLTDALTALAREYAGGRCPAAAPLVPLPDSEAVVSLSPREAVYAPQERMDFSRSAGRICAETVTCYPPGIPVLFPGERITPAAITYCQALERQGFAITGPEDPTMKTVGVVA